MQSELVGSQRFSSTLPSHEFLPPSRALWARFGRLQRWPDNQRLDDANDNHRLNGIDPFDHNYKPTRESLRPHIDRLGLIDFHDPNSLEFR